MEKTARENFVLDERTVKTFREIATAVGINKSELFRRMVQKEAEDNKLLLQKWRELEKLRK